MKPLRCIVVSTCRVEIGRKKQQKKQKTATKRKPKTKKNDDDDVDEVKNKKKRKLTEIGMARLQKRICNEVKRIEALTTKLKTANDTLAKLRAMV